MGCKEGGANSLQGLEKSTKPKGRRRGGGGPHPCPGDAGHPHGTYVALPHHRDGRDLHFGRDDFGDQNRLVRTLSRDHAKDRATDYDPAQSCFASSR